MRKLVETGSQNGVMSRHFGMKKKAVHFFCRNPCANALFFVRALNSATWDMMCQSLDDKLYTSMKQSCAQLMMR